MRKIFFLFLLPVFCASYAQTYSLSGRITGYDNRPLIIAHAFLYDGKDTVAWTQADGNGKYQLKYAVNKTYELHVVGLHHQRYTTKIYPYNKPDQQLDVQLGTFTYLSTTEKIIVIGDFNKFSTIDDVINPIMKNGKTNIDLTGKSGRYIIAGLVRGYVLSGISKNYKLNDLRMGGDGYMSVIDENQRDAGFDMAQLPPPGIAPVIVSSNKMGEKMNAIQVETRAKESKYLSKVMSLSGRTNWEGFEPIDLTEEYAKLEDAISKEKDPIEKQLLLARYLAIEGTKTKFQLSKSEPVSLFKGEAKKEYIVEALRTIDPMSPLWSTTAELIKAPLSAKPELLGEFKPFYDSILSLSVDGNLRMGVLAALTNASYRNNDERNGRNYYGWLKSEYPQSFEVIRLKKLFDIKDDITELKTAAAFSLPSIEDPSKIISNETMKGKYYLLDFWSVGCGGCILKLPKLHEVYEKYKDKNFEIVSVALNPTVQMTKDFRKKKYPMPWTNVQPDNIFDSQVAKDFNVNFLPRTFLIDPKGKIVASDQDLAGGLLDEVLKKYLH